MNMRSPIQWNSRTALRQPCLEEILWCKICLSKIQKTTKLFREKWVFLKFLRNHIGKLFTSVALISPKHICRENFLLCNTISTLGYIVAFSPHSSLPTSTSLVSSVLYNLNIHLAVLMTCTGMLGIQVYRQPQGTWFWYDKVRRVVPRVQRQEESKGNVDWGEKPS